MLMNEDTKRQTDMKNAALRAADVLRGLANSDRLLLMGSAWKTENILR